MPIFEQDAVLLERFLGPARATRTRAEWDAEYDAGRALSQEQAATLLLAIKELPAIRAARTAVTWTTVVLAPLTR